MIRWLVDHYLRARFHHRIVSETELTAEGDKSRSVLLASGYIAGSAITGNCDRGKRARAQSRLNRARIEDWSTAHNPFFNGDYADLLALIPFAVLFVPASLSSGLRRASGDTAKASENLVRFLVARHIHAAVSCFNHFL